MVIFHSYVSLPEGNHQIQAERVGFLMGRRPRFDWGRSIFSMETSHQSHDGSMVLVYMLT